MKKQIQFILTIKNLSINNSKNSKYSNFVSSSELIQLNPLKSRCQN